MADDLISVIVPVYNVEKYLRQCVDSILAQTYKKLEVILVDDGSTDDSGNICDGYAKQDSRVKVIHQANGGLSVARNAGLTAMTGCYFAFCDSDDWMEANILQIAHDEMLRSQGKIVIWGFRVDNVDHTGNLLSAHKVSGELCCECSGGYKYLLTFPFCKMYGYAWNKLYTAEFKSERFPTGISLVEDTIYNAKNMTCCTKLMFIDNIGTHYIQRPSTTLGTAFYPDYYDLILQAERANASLYRHFGAPEDAIEQFSITYLFAACQAFIRRCLQNTALDRVGKYALIADFLERRDVKRQIELYRPQKLQDHIYKFLFQKRYISGISILEFLRNARKSR